KIPTNYSAQEPGTGLEPAEQGITSTTTTSFTTNLLNTLRHPKVLGMLFVFLVAVFALIFLTKPTK
nr:serine/threonine protein kinase [Nanoarchaeota archaeon]